MESSEANTVQPSRSGSNRPAAVPSVFAGTVTGVKKENGVQTLEVQYSQGKVRFEADGDFQAGEKVRLAFPGGNAVQVAKGGASPTQMDGLAGQGPGYTLPQNLASMRAFETSVGQWMANVGTGTPGKTGPGVAPQLSEALAKLSLPELLIKVMATSGGKDFLSQSYGNLDRNLMGSLMEAIEATKGDAGAKASLLDILKASGRGLDQTGAEGPKNLDGFWSAEAGAGASPWFGRVMEKSDGQPFMSPMSRLQYGSAPPKVDPMFRYLLDVGGRTMEVFSSQSMQQGDLADFAVETHGGRMQARFMDPSASLPAGLRADFANAIPAMRQAMQLSSHYLQDFKDEPYYGKLVKDFSQVLSQSGSMAGSGNGLPNQKELDGLLRLFVTFPRDGQQPDKQAKAWGEAVRNPQAMLDLLKNLRPDKGASLLRSGTDLQLARNPLALTLSEHGGTPTPDVMASWLKKMLPDGFQPGDLQRLADDNAALAATGKDQDPAKFLLQAVVNSFPKDDTLQQGKPGQFYFYQGQEWQGLKVTWEKSQKDGHQSKSGRKDPVTIRVETHAKHMGDVKVGVTLEPKGAKIDFQNQFHNVRDLFSQAIPDLERSLDYLDFKVQSWTYAMLPEETQPPTGGGWTHPSSLSDGVNLDLFG